MQDEITLILATEMQVNLTEGEQARMRYSSTSNVEAWNLWVQGLGISAPAWRRSAPLSNATAQLAHRLQAALFL